MALNVIISGILAIIIGILVIAFPHLISYFVGGYLILAGILLLVNF